MSLLRIHDLSIHYEKVKAVESISMDVDKGSIVTLIGANGAGKTSILRTVSGLVHPTSGEVWYSDRRIDRLPPEEIVRAGVAHVPEGRQLFPRMTVLENLKMGAFLQKNRKQISGSLEEVYLHFPILKERAKQRAGTLSGGQQQMLAVGRALMARPQLLLSDEPSFGLAPLLVAEIAKILVDIRQQGRTILLVEQNAHMALSIADKGYVLETGSITLTGESNALLNNEHVKKAYIGG
jgi:branched-chain amino acid transport system ATP-binding protein